MSSKAVADFLGDLKTPEATKTNTPRPRREWRCLMGQVLEYGDSGYQIVLMKHGKAQFPFQMRDPEGRVFGEGNHLDSMKRAVEEQAKFRDEFTVDASSFDAMPKFGGTSHEGEPS